MRARVAYISSFGTTAILVAAALFILAVVGTIVAFRGWPGGSGGAQVQSVPLAPPAQGRLTASVRRPAPVHRRAVSVAASRRAVPRVSTAGLVKAAPPTGARVHVVPGVVMVPVSTVTMQAPPQRAPQTAQQAGPDNRPVTAPDDGPVASTLELISGLPLPPPPAQQDPAGQDVPGMADDALAPVTASAPAPPSASTLLPGVELPIPLP